MGIIREFLYLFDIQPIPGHWVGPTLASLSVLMTLAQGIGVIIGWFNG